MHKLLICSSLVVAACGAASIGSAQMQVWYHPADLNWEFRNLTGTLANDFEIIIEDPNYNPDVNDPSQVFTDLHWDKAFPYAQRDVGDFDGDGDDDVRIRWYGDDFGPGEVAHVGLDTAGAKHIIGAQWSFNGDPIDTPQAITFERTRVTQLRSEFAINMELNFAQSYFDDPNNPGVAAWTNIRTWVDIPADVLSLVDLNDTLDLDALSNYETTPRIGDENGPIIRLDDVFQFDDASIFDVWVANTAFASPDYESLLYAEIVTGRQDVIGWFWNLNPQSPTPGTLALLCACGLLAARRR